MTPRKRFEVIGKPRRRVDGRAKVTGLTRFADDIMLPRMLTSPVRKPIPACTSCSPARTSPSPSASCR